MIKRHWYESIERGALSSEMKFRPVLLWRHMKIRFENAGKVTRVVIAQMSCDLSNAHICALKVFL